VLGLTDEPTVRVHRWTYARPVPDPTPPQPSAQDRGPVRPAGTPYATDGRVWLAGDAFGKPRVQTAWLSGRAVARAILAGQSTER
jgi:predicted NAD/FAD-dependent oxidoreductase